MSNLIGDIPSGWAALAGASVVMLGTSLVAWWQFRTGTISQIRQQRIARLEDTLAQLISRLQILAFSCRHNTKIGEDELKLHEAARFSQNLLTVLLDPTDPGVKPLFSAVEEAFGKLKPPRRLRPCRTSLTLRPKSYITDEMC